MRPMKMTKKKKINSYNAFIFYQNHEIWPKGNENLGGGWYPPPLLLIHVTIFDMPIGGLTHITLR